MEPVVEFWWPTPSAFDDLVVEENEQGFTLSAPDDTECGEWLAHWNQSEEHQEIFNQAFTDVLMDHIKTLETENGKTEAISDEQSNHRGETEENCAGVLS
jgi:hypothetical protein